MLEPHLPQIGDLSDLISKARSGFSHDSRAQWYPRLPKIVLGMHTICSDPMVVKSSIVITDHEYLIPSDGSEVMDMTYTDLLLTCEKKFKVLYRCHSTTLIH